VTSDRGQDLPASVFGSWVRVPEEESEGGVEVYRPAGHPLPPARGRIGLELHPDGRFAYRGIGATDVPSTVEGHWRSDRPGELTLEVGDQGLTLEVLDAGEDVLKVRHTDQ
jgi:hypothetical protein